VTITIITLFPEVFTEFLRSSIIGRGIEKKLLKVRLINPRDYARDKHKTCDDAPFGGGAGMVLKAEPLARALRKAGAGRKRVIYPSPGGKLLRQTILRELAALKEIIIVCGHYEGIDQRIIDTFVTDEISIGDYVVSAGETAAMVLVDAVTRLIDGVIKRESLEEESFQNGLLEYPHYTRPRKILGMEVPEVLLNGNHEEIRKWRLAQSIKKTQENRPDLLKNKLSRPEGRKK
jgi:tRNA (guanine37-N1)-methyltransferase